MRDWVVEGGHGRRDADLEGRTPRPLIELCWRAALAASSLDEALARIDGSGRPGTGGWTRARSGRSATSWE
jgi:hypothetical protein